METTRTYWGDIGRMEKRMETTRMRDFSILCAPSLTAMAVPRGGCNFQLEAFFGQ